MSNAAPNKQWAVGLLSDYGIGTLMALLATGNLFIPQISDYILLNPSVVCMVICTVLALGPWSRKGFRLGRTNGLMLVSFTGFIPGIAFAGDNPYAASKVVGLLATAFIITSTVELLDADGRRRVFLSALAGLLTLLILTFNVLRHANDTVSEAILGVFLFAIVNASLSGDLVGNRLMWVMIGVGLSVDWRARRAVPHYAPDYVPTARIMTPPPYRSVSR